MIKLPLASKAVPTALTALEQQFRNELICPAAGKESAFEINYHSLVVQLIDTLK